MSKIQQKPITTLTTDNSSIPDWFYFIFGMMLVFFSAIDAKGQNQISNHADPNEMTVSPEGYFKNDQELVYEIRFQNVGNTMATTVTVEDRLPNGLDLNTLEIGLASHPYRFELVSGNKLVWTFENINLPDSLTDEVESHGYITFKIKPKKQLTDGMILENNAYIFFDNMVPIRTNTVVNITGREPYKNAMANQVLIFPNPMIDQSTIQIVPDRVDEIKIISLFVSDLSGKKLIEKTINPVEKFIFEKGELAPGFYILNAVGDDGKNYSGKVLIN